MAGQTETLVDVASVIVFFSYCRVQLSIRGPRNRTSSAIGVDLLVERESIPIKSDVDETPDRIDVVVETLIHRPLRLDACELIVADGPTVHRFELNELARLARRRDGSSLNERFRGLIRDAVAAEPHRPPLLLDIGGRARSGVERRHEYPECHVVVVDIHPDPSVDIVCDAHELGSTFIGEMFDFALCVSVFEHVLMPWKVVLEMNRVLKLGACCLLHTHQTIGMHDLPWDFWRYSDTSWHGLFNAQTGFEVVQTSMAQFMHVVPRAWGEEHEHAERSGGFEGSSVIVRKVGRSALRWDVSMSAVIDSTYPLHADGGGRAQSDLT